MAKKKNKKGKIEKSLDTIDTSVNSILNEYKPLSKKERTKKLSELNRKLKKAVKKNNIFEIKSAKLQIKNLKSKEDKLPIQYGIFNFQIKRDYFERIKKKEQYLDGLFHRKMKHLLQKYEAPKTEQEAKALEGLITQYSKKIKDTKFYDPTIVENNINKLTNYRNKELSAYDYSDFIRGKKEIIDKEVTDYESGEEIGDYYEEETGESEEIYKAVEKPILIDDSLAGIQFNFF